MTIKREDQWLFCFSGTAINGDGSHDQPMSSYCNEIYAIELIQNWNYLGWLVGCKSHKHKYNEELPDNHVSYCKLTKK